MTDTEKGSRITALDVARGIAVLLMVQQHTGFWFWNSGGSLNAQLAAHPIYVGINGLGGLAAPLFILLSGIGAALSVLSGKKDLTMVRRGLIIILFGILVCTLTPAWFSPWGWYVLHLIGSGMCIVPIIRRVPSAFLLALSSVIVFATPFLLGTLEMPTIFSAAFMRGSFGVLPILKLALAGGHFPLFPWLALFITGFVCGRWISHGGYPRLPAAAAGCVGAALAILLPAIACPDPIAHTGWGMKLITISLYMFPAYPIQFLSLAAAAVFIVWASLFVCAKARVSSSNIMALSGRVSLTLFILHVLIIRNFMTYTGLWQSFSMPAAAALQIAVLGLIAASVYFWNKKDFRYGFEWLMRKAG